MTFARSATADDRRDLLQVGADHADAMIGTVCRQDAPVGEHHDSRRAAEAGLCRRPILVPQLVGARDGAYFLPIWADHANAVVTKVNHQDAATEQNCDATWCFEQRLSCRAVAVAPTTAGQ